MHTRYLIVAAIVSLLLGCGKTPENYVERPVEQLYNEAQDLLSRREYTLAAKAFDEVERQHPYSVWATKAQLMAAYSHYQKNAYDDAIIALDRFIQLHPSNVDVPYAYYLKALCYYEQISDVGRDQKMTELALKALQDLNTRFPNTRYARDATLKLDLTRDHLAGKEMEIGRYYLNQGQYLAAINRFKFVVDTFQTTTHVPEALHRLSESYKAIGLVEDARKTAAILGHNFPGSEWYMDSYDLVEGAPMVAQKAAPWYWPWASNKKAQPVRASAPDFKAESVEALPAGEFGLDTKMKQESSKRWYWPF